MVNSDFNLDMDNYLRKIRKKRTDPIDYSNGKAKVSANEKNINDLPDDEIIIEEREENGFKKFFVSIFRKNKKTNKLELEEEFEKDIPIEEANEMINEIEDDFEDEFFKTESFFKRFFSRMFPKRLDVDDINEELIDAQLDPDVSNLLEDTKKTFKSINHWLEKLPTNEKTAFKNSEDFIIYTEFLKKYRLIR